MFSDLLVRLIDCSSLLTHHCCCLDSAADGVTNGAGNAVAASEAVEADVAAHVVAVVVYWKFGRGFHE